MAIIRLNAPCCGETEQPRDQAFVATDEAHESSYIVCRCPECTQVFIVKIRPLVAEILVEEGFRFALNPDLDDKTEVAEIMMGKEVSRTIGELACERDIKILANITSLADVDPSLLPPIEGES